MLTSIARKETESLHIDSCSVAYVPIIGYLLVVPEYTHLRNESDATMVSIYVLVPMPLQKHTHQDIRIGGCMPL